MSGGGGGGSKNSAAAEELYRTQADISRQQWDQYQEFGAPLFNRLASDALEGPSESEIGQRVTAAGTDVDQSFDQAEGQLQRNLGRYGVNPTSGRYAGSLRNLSLGRAASKAGAMTSARRGVEEDTFRRRLSVLNPGQGLAASAQRGLASAAAGQQGLADAAADRQSQFWGGVGQLGGTLGAAYLLSDPEVKTDKKEVGRLHNGLAVYRYRYLGEPATHIGVMADEVEEVNPSAVKRLGGLRRVNYAKAVEGKYIPAARQE